MSPHIHVDHLIVVAGPSFSGKSTFIRWLQRGRMPDVQKALGIARAENWVMESATTVGDLGEKRIDRMILHYDITRMLGKAPEPWRRAEPIAVMKDADVLTVVNIWTAQDVLLRRLHGLMRLVQMAEAVRARRPLRMLRIAVEDARASTLPAHARYALASLFTRRIRSRLERVDETRSICGWKETLYRDARALRELYTDWISFCDGLEPAAQYAWRGDGPVQHLTEVSAIMSERLDAAHSH